MKHFSKFGLMLVGLYDLIAIVFWFTEKAPMPGQSPVDISLVCYGERSVCFGIGLVLFSPWLFLLLQIGIPLGIPAIIVASFFNAGIVYTLGFAIEAIAKWLFNGSRNPEIS